jgi:hypothetical protein
MAKKPTKRYIVILSVMVLSVVAVAALGLLDMRPAAKEGTMNVSADMLNS